MKSLEYDIKKPKIEGVYPLLKRLIGEVMSSGMKESYIDECMEYFKQTHKYYKLLFETQEEDNQPFHTHKIWHTDSSGFPHTTSVFYTSTPAVYMSGKLILHDTISSYVSQFIERDFTIDKHKGTSLYLSMFVMHDLFGAKWLEDLVHGSSEIEQFVEIETAEFMQLEPFQVGVGMTQETLYKSPARQQGEPTNRIVGYHAEYR